MVPWRISFQRKGLNIVFFRAFFFFFFIKESSSLSLGKFCFEEVRLSTVSLLKGAISLLQGNLFLKSTCFTVIFYLTMISVQH